MDRLSVLIIEDDALVCQAYREYADRLDDVSLIGSTGDAARALEMIQDHLPQAIILDLELQKGSGSGLDVLRGMQDMELGVKPFVLVVTINGSAVIQKRARRYGADYIISKEQWDYSERNCLDRLRSWADDIQCSYHSGVEREEHPEAPSRKRDRLIRRIHTELNNVGIKNIVLGYKYLTDGILLTIDDPTQDIMAVLAERYGKTEINIYHAMQRAIERAWRTAGIETILEHYDASVSSESGVPTVTEFIFHYADRIRPQY